MEGTERKGGKKGRTEGRTNGWQGTNARRLARLHVCTSEEAATRGRGKGEGGGGSRSEEQLWAAALVQHLRGTAFACGTRHLWARSSPNLTRMIIVLKHITSRQHKPTCGLCKRALSSCVVKRVDSIKKIKQLFMPLEVPASDATRSPS